MNFFFPETSTPPFDCLLSFAPGQSLCIPVAYYYWYKHPML